MKKTLAAAGAALTLAVLLSGCSSEGLQARALANRWLSGDASAQCLNVASTWSQWELGRAELVGEVDGAERWAVAISGTRSMAPEDGGHLLVDISDDDGSCVRWYEGPLP
jgi:hypothetical protein